MTFTSVAAVAGPTLAARDPRSCGDDKLERPVRYEVSDVLSA